MKKVTPPQTIAITTTPGTNSPYFSIAQFSKFSVEFQNGLSGTYYLYFYTYVNSFPQNVAQWVLVGNGVISTYIMEGTSSNGYLATLARINCNAYTSGTTTCTVVGELRG